MTKADDFLANVIEPGAAWAGSVPGWKPPFDDRAKVLLLAIAGQESAWTERVQSGNGPAHGFWQFERAGGVRGVLRMAVAKAVCARAGIPANETNVWRTMATPSGDNLAVAFARLLLWSDPKPLPAIGDEQAAYDYYVRNWRPGKPSRERWSVVYPQAVAAVKGRA